jgi:glycerophosphoryl diester phosphodiesterase
VAGSTSGVATVAAAAETRIGSMRRGIAARPAALVGTLLAVALVAVSTFASAFDLQGHRGTRGHEPENTLSAFRRALEIGVDTLEMDAAITADGVVVISHDPQLPAAITRDAQGHWLTGPGPLIRNLTFAQLQTYDVGRIDPSSDYARQFPLQQPRDGERRPKLADVFALVKSMGAEHVRFDIETKVFPDRPDATLPPEPFVRALLDVIRTAGMTSRVMIESFDWRTLKLVQQLEPGLETVYLTSRSHGYDTLEGGTWTAGMLLRDYPSIAHMVKAAGGRIWSPNFPSLAAADVKTAQQLGLKVIPWTVNAPADIERLLDWGVDGIISDYPDRVRTALQKRGMPLPPAIAPK